MNALPHNVVRLRQIDGAILVSAKPKVFTPELVGHLEVLNRAVRWLRKNGITPLTIDLMGPRPTIMVRPIASGFLISAGKGVSTCRQPEGTCLCSVVIDDCSIQWQRRTDS